MSGRECIFCGLKSAELCRRRFRVGLFIRQFGLLSILLSVESSSYFHGNIMQTKAIAAYVENWTFILCEIVSHGFSTFIAWLVIPMTVNVEVAFWIIVTITSLVAWRLGISLRSVGYQSKPFKRVTFVHVWDMPERLVSVYRLRKLVLLNMQWMFAGFSHVMFLKPIFMNVRERKHDVLLCIWPVPQCHVASGVCSVLNNPL